MIIKCCREGFKVAAVKPITERGGAVSDVARFSSGPTYCPLINNPRNLI